MKKYFRSLSLVSCWIMAIVFTWTVFNIGNFKEWRSPISYDVTNYYCYLPAIFVEGDLTLKFYDANPEWFVNKYAPNKAPNGSNVIKMTMGLSFYYAPFFFIAHGYALLFDNPDGYSTPYRLMLLLGTVFFSVLGLLYLRKLLLLYFTESAATLVLLSLGIGTNLFYYTVHEPMSHAYLFFTFVIIMYYTVQWHRLPSIKDAARIGFFSGLAILIRPTDGIILLIPLLYSVTSIVTLQTKLALLITHWKHVMLLGIVLCIPISFQLIYWKMVTGQWIFFSYVGEGFLWNDPEIWNGLFSYRKGWFLYTPIISFAFLGFFFLYRYCRDFFVPILLFTIINIYVVLSWWSWWYGGSFGLRSFIESYALLALPMGACYQWLLKSRWSTLLLVAVIILLSTINQIQTFQYRHYYIHWDSQSKAAYWYVFLKMNLTEEEKTTLGKLQEQPPWQRYEKLQQKQMQEGNK
ncbi:MAG: hypothetical protein KBF32_05225 [Chitinophagales bacterium]|nr:hypothetical protein [Chitinophagales bacterium]